MLTTPWLRRAALAAVDVASWTLAVAVVIGLRYSFTITDVQWASIVRYWFLVCLLLLAIGYATKFYRGRFLVGSFDEALGLAMHMGFVAVVGLVMRPLLYPEIPRSMPVTAPALALLISAAVRWLYRALRDREREGTVGGAAPVVRNALIYGAGDAGQQVARLIRNDPDLAFRVVGYVDDNPGKRHLKILGVPVLGDGSQLLALTSTYDVDTVIFAIPGASGEVIGRAQDTLQSAGLTFLVLPRLSELIGGTVKRDDLREVEIGDVLGRHQVSTDLSSIADYLTGKRVLITGAGGSIGAELARQVHHFGPATLVLLDRDE